MSKRTKELRQLDLLELKTRLKEAKDNYIKELVKSKTGGSNKAVNLRNLRKDIARMLTIITEKEVTALKSAAITKKAKPIKNEREKERVAEALNKKGKR